MTQTETSAQDRSPYLPWPLMAAALLSFLALYLSGKPFIAVPVLAVLLVATYATRRRLPDSRILQWVLRAVLFGLIIAIGPDRTTAGMPILLEMDYVHMFGYLCAAELALRAWMPGRAFSRGEFLLLTALIMTAASNTYSRRHFQLLTPIYLMVVLVALRSFALRRGAVPRPLMPTQRRRSLLALRIVAMVLALAIGWSVVATIATFEYRLTRWAVQLLREGRGSAREIALSATPQLRAVFNPHPSQQRVLIIEGTRSPQHLRALAFDTYERQLWRPVLGERQFQPVDPAALRPPQPQRIMRFTRLGDTLDLLPLPLSSAGVESMLAIEREPLGALRLQEPVERARYQVAASPSETFQGPLASPITGAQRQAALRVPDEVDPQVSRLARDIAGDGPPLMRAMRIAQHLRSQHQYSLVYDPGDAEPLSDFVLNRRSAHCQYFASALVVMARAAGVPARFVTGYFAHEPYGSDAIVVRDQDAHAWAECWIDGIGWITMDATPASGRPSALYEQPPGWRKWLERLQDIPARVREWLTRPWPTRTLLWIALPAAVLLAMWLVWRIVTRRRRRIAPSADYPPTSEALASAARRFGRHLRRRGVPCAANVTWREHLDALARAPAPQRPIDTAACISFVDAYDEARFGGEDGEATRRLAQLIGSLESTT